MKHCILLLVIFNVIGCATKSISPEITGAAIGLTRITHHENSDFNPRLSPNGKDILFTEMESENKILFWQNSNKLSVIKKRVGSPGRTKLSDKGFYPTWFPDAESIAFISTITGSNRLVKTYVTGGGITFISNAQIAKTVLNPDINPAGDVIVVCVKLQDKFHVATLNVGGSNFTVLTEGCSPVWSPDGNNLAFDKVVSDKPQIFVMKLGEGQTTQITTSHKNSQPTWSPDQKYLAFISDRSDKSNHLFIMKADGTAQTQLTKGISTESRPFWGIDGNIYFTFQGTTNTDIWRVKPKLPK